MCRGPAFFLFPPPSRSWNFKIAPNAMTDNHFNVGEFFRTQFIWRIPSGDFLRAIFEVEVMLIDEISDKYVVRLEKFLAGRQETPEGEDRSIEKASKEYWALVNALTGNKISLAFEVDDGRPLWLRFETLTGEHNFFHRLNELPPTLAEWPAKN
jgi:hypothetical protein